MANDLKRNDQVAKALDHLRLIASMLALVVATQLVPAPWRLVAELTDRRITSGRDLDGALEALTLGAASVAVWLLLGWVTTLGMLTLLARAPGALGRVARSTLARITPGFLRRSIAIGMSVGALTGVAVSTAPTVTATPVSAGITVDDPASRIPVTGGRLADPIARAAAAVAQGVDRVGDHASPGPSPRSALGVTDGHRVAHGTAAVDPVPGPPAAAPGTAAATSGTAARGVPSPMSTAEIDLDWPVRRPVTTTRAPVELDWPTTTTVVVHRGDTLWSIAARQLGPDATDAEIDAAWHRWFAVNRAVIGDDPGLILPGQRLRAPAAP